MTPKRRLNFAAIALVISLSGFANEESARARIDKVLRDFHVQGKFNGVVLAADNGHIVYHKAYGQASFHDDRLAGDSVFRLASVSKTFTQMVMVLLCR